MTIAVTTTTPSPAIRALTRTCRWNLVLAAAVISFLGTTAFDALAQAERVLGADISYWDCPKPTATDNYEITQDGFNTAYSSGPGGGNRVFVQIRSSRGGLWGLDQGQGTPYPGGSLVTDQKRYDDPRFYQNLKRALAAGMQVGSYHRAFQDSSDGAGTNEALHMIQVAGPWMRPGYTVPMFDWEDGGFNQTQAERAIAFSDQIYAVMQIRPCVYIGGYNSSLLESLAAAGALGTPATYMPSVTNRFYMLWNPRYPPSAYDVQTSNPKDSYSGFYGPWDSYVTDPHPWSFWQYSSTLDIPGLHPYRTGHNDNNVCHGDLEYLRNYLVPAVWWNDSSGSWSTTNNWNCGQPPTPITWGTNQAPRFEEPTYPVERLPGQGGTLAASGEYDTVILERPNANITVTLSNGTYNIRKLFMRETLNITGGSLTVNYNPAYRPDTSSTVRHAGPISAQFTGPVTLSGSGALNVNTLQVDANRTFSINGGSLAFTAISLIPGTTPATLLIGGNVTYGAYPGSSATITNGAGSGSSGRIILSGGTRTFNVNSGVDLYAEVPISNGGIIKSGAGTLHLDSPNSYAAGTTINDGTLEAGVSGAIPGNVTNSAGVLKLDSNTAMASTASLVLADSPAAAAVNLAFTGTQTINALYFGGVRQAAGTWGAAGAAHNHPAFSGSGILSVTTGPTTSSTSVSRTAGTSPDAYGDTLTFRATVTGNSPTGTVQFKVNGVSVGSPVTLVSGSASFSTNSLPVSGSPHQITAFYSGDSNNTPSDNSASPLAQSITAKSLTAALTGTVSKTYNGTTAATLAPANYSLPGVLSGDTVSLNNPSGGTYDNRNVGTGKTVSVTGLSLLGASAGNYTLSSTTASAAIGAIAKANLTVTAAPNTKTYDGTTSASASPTITSGSIQAGDSAPAWTETYDNKDVGTGKTLTPAGTVNDGNGGANYLITYAVNTSGVINALPTSCSLVSSVNPSGPGTNVIFTATVTGVPPAADLPTGNVIFSANGSPFATAPLTSGSASAANASLPLGANTITAEYVLTQDFLGSTTNLVQEVKLFTTCSQTNALLSVTNHHDGTFTLTFLGTLQAQYYLLGSPNVAAPMFAWTPVGGSTNTVTNTSGLWQFTVTNTAAQQFYRSAAVEPCQ